MTPEFHSQWLDLYFGKPGTKERYAFEVASAFNGVELLQKKSLNDAERKEIRRKYRAAIKLVRAAFLENDAQFFRRIADGLDRLRIHQEDASVSPELFLLWSYHFLCSQDAPAPSKSELVAFTYRAWAIGHLLEMEGSLAAWWATRTYDSQMESKIARQILQLPRQKWGNHFKALGLKLRPGKSGPKKRV